LVICHTFHGSGHVRHTLNIRRPVALQHDLYGCGRSGRQDRFVAAQQKNSKAGIRPIYDLNGRKITLIRHSSLQRVTQFGFLAAGGAALRVSGWLV
jgi:hypothetical protein